MDASNTCPLCSAESLRRELGIRRGQDLTSSLTVLKELSEEDYTLALERLDRFGNGIIRADFEDRVRRAKKKRTLSAMRRPAAAVPTPAVAPGAGGEGAAD